MKTICKYISATAVIASMGFHASAQDDTNNDAEPRRLNTVSVTAQKREQNIQDVPISITAYGSEFIEKSNVQNLTDISLFTPNFTITSSSTRTNSRVAIRGVGSVGNAGIEPAVGVFIDGVYYPRPGSVVGNLIDIEAIEVLRGPQGTLFGRNTSMGALNVRTKDPSDTFEAYGEMGFGSFDAFDVGGSLSGPLSDSVSGRMSAKYNEREGYGTNLLNGENFGDDQNLNIRGKLLFDVSDAFQIKLSADYGEINSGGNTIELLDDSVGPAFLARLEALGGPDASQVATGDPFDHNIYQDQRDLWEDSQWGLAVDASYELGSGHSIRSITSYREWEVETFSSAIRVPFQILPLRGAQTTETFSQELQLVSPEGREIEYLIGAFFYDESYGIDSNLSFGADFCSPLVALVAGAGAAAGCAAGPQDAASTTEFSQDLQSTAIFGQGTWNFNDKAALTLGARWTADDKTGAYANTVTNAFMTALSIRENESHPNLSVDDSKFTYFANLSYYPVDDTMLFGTVSTGYKSGGFNTGGAFPGLTLDQRVFNEEDTTNYELGIKTQTLSDTLQLNATLFRTNIEGFQDRAFDGLSFITRNVGELRQQGVEADFVWAPLDQLQLLGGVSYLDSEFLDYQDASPLPGGPVQDLTGERAHLSPEWQGSLIADWADAFSPISGTDYFLRGETQYVGEANWGANTNQNPQTIQDGYQLFNASVGLRADDDRWEVSLWGKNLTDEGYCQNIFEQPFGGALGAVDAAANRTVQRCAVGAPETWGVRLKVRN